MSEEKNSGTPATSVPEVDEQQVNEETNEGSMNLDEWTVVDQESSDVVSDEEGPKSKASVECLLKRSIFTSGKRISFHPFFDKQDQIDYAKEALEVGDIPKVKALQETQLKTISTENELKEVVKKLEKVGEIGVALMMTNSTFNPAIHYIVISIDEADYGIDVKKMDEHLDLLAPIFLDPNITKIMNIVPNVLVWLQEERGLFVANAFDISVAFKIVPDIYTVVRKQFKSVFATLLNNGSVRLYEKKEQEKKIPADHRIQVWSHFNLYMYRALKKALLAQFGTRQYLKIKHAMDDVCKFQYVSCTKILHLRLLHNLRMDQEVHKKRVAELWTWRQRVAKAQNINARKVLTINNIIMLASVTITDADFLKSVAVAGRPQIRSEFVKGDIAEVRRILTSNSFPHSFQRNLIAQGLEREKFSATSKTAVKRNLYHAKPDDSSVAKRQRLNEGGSSKGNLTHPKQPAKRGGPTSRSTANVSRGDARGSTRGRGGGGGSFSTPKTAPRYIPQRAGSGSAQSPRGRLGRGTANRSATQHRTGQISPRRSGDFRNTARNFENDSRNSERSSRDSDIRSRNSSIFSGNRSRDFGRGSGSDNFRNSRENSGNFQRHSGNFRDSSRSFDDSRNRSASSWGNSRSFGHSSGNFERGSGSFDDFRDEGRFETVRETAGSNGNASWGPANRRDRVDNEMDMISMQIQLLQRKLEMKRDKQRGGRM